MMKITQTIIVEGKYDKIKLESVADANIITTDGFRIYNNTQKRALIKSLAEKTGIIILTDSDSAGRRIRNFIKSCAGGAKIINAYIPRIAGKEKRKNIPSKENILGVEGTEKDLLTDVLKRFAVVENIENNKNNEREAEKITKQDFYADGLSGGKDSAKKREYLCDVLNIPYMQSNSLLECVNILSDYENYKKIVGEYKKI